MTLFRHDSASRSSLERLLRSVAHATGCRSSVFYRLDGQVACNFGNTSSQDLEDGEAQLLCDTVSEQEDALLVVDIDAPSGIDAGLRPLLCRSRDGGTLFAACIIVRTHDGTPLGILQVASDCRRETLTMAQRYVMRTHAARLALYHNRRMEELPRDFEGDSSQRLRLLESVMVNANDAILITEAEPIDAPGPRVVYCNAAFTRTTGFQPEEIIGRTPRILQSSNTSRDSLDLIRRSLSIWQPVEVELLNRRRDGSEFWVEVSIVPVANDNGFFTHWVAVQRDISDRRRAEEIERRAREAHAENLVLEAQLLERQRVEQTLSWQASHDNLTHLYNRSWLMQRLAALLEDEQARSRGAALLFMDLDRFKSVNDTLGHRAGDHLLIEMARRIESCLREGDMLARIGGDEFVVVVQDCEPDSAAISVAGRIIDSLSAPFRVEGQSLFSTTSIGIVTSVERYSDAEAWLRDADAAMYLAKRHGPGGYRFFTDDMRRRHSERQSLKSALRQVLLEQQYQLYFEPLISPHTGRLEGCVAGPRWHDPVHGHVGADKLLEIASEIGILREVGRRILSAACRRLSAWRRDYPASAGSLVVMVRASLQEVRHPEFIDELQLVLQESGLPAKRLRLELDAEELAGWPELIRELPDSLDGLGVQVAIGAGGGMPALDYFESEGVGAVSLNVDIIQRALTQPRTRAIVAGLCDLGQRLSMDVIAAGVESDELLAGLSDMGCQQVGGPLLHPPLPADAFERLLRDSEH